MFLGTRFRRAFGLLGARFLGVLGALVGKDGRGKEGKEYGRSMGIAKNGRGKILKMDAAK